MAFGDSQVVAAYACRSGVVMNASAGSDANLYAGGWGQLQANFGPSFGNSRATSTQMACCGGASRLSEAASGRLGVMRSASGVATGPGRVRSASRATNSSADDRGSYSGRPV